MGITKAVRHSEFPVGALAVAVSDAALDDAGLSRSDIDGVACGSGLPSGLNRRQRQGVDVVGAEFLTTHMGLQPVWHLDDALLPPALLFAVEAIASGAATYVLVNRTLHNPASPYNGFYGVVADGDAQWTAPYGNPMGPAAIAMAYMEYQQLYGARRQDMATLAVQIRKNVQKIPLAYWHGHELTIDDYMACRMISEPVCLFDNDIPVDCSCSFVLTSAERARDLSNRPVYITAGARVRNAKPFLPGSVGPLDNHYEGGSDLASRLWRRSGWRPRDVDVVEIYDGFTPLVYFWLEALGFCPVGEAWRFIQDGRIDPKGPFPLLSGGGNQGWGRLHGIPQILECYVQLSKRAGERQLPHATTALSTFGLPGLNSGTGILYSSAIDA